VQYLRELGVNRQRPIIGGKGILVALQSPQHLALVVPGDSIVGVEGQRTVTGGQRLGVALEADQSGAPGAPGGGVVGVEASARSRAAISSS
jgi:hypothetical protein